MQNELAIKITLSMHSKFVAAVFRLPLLLQIGVITSVASDDCRVFLLEPNADSFMYCQREKEREGERETEWDSADAWKQIVAPTAGEFVGIFVTAII